MDCPWERSIGSSAPEHAASVPPELVRDGQPFQRLAEDSRAGAGGVTRSRALETVEGAAERLEQTELGEPGIRLRRQLRELAENALPGGR